MSNETIRAAVDEALERAARLAETDNYQFATQEWFIAQEIRKLKSSCSPGSAPTNCVPCPSCGLMRRENCRDYPNHAHEWCDCQ